MEQASLTRLKTTPDTVISVAFFQMNVIFFIRDIWSATQSFWKFVDQYGPDQFKVLSGKSAP